MKREITIHDFGIIDKVLTLWKKFILFCLKYLMSKKYLRYVDMGIESK